MDGRLPFDDIDQLARVQAGHIARWQLLRLHVPLTVVERMAHRYGWVPVFTGSLRLPGHDHGPAGLLWAATLAAASTAARRADVDPALPAWEGVHQLARHAYGVDGLSAAWLHDLVPNAPTKPQLLLPHHARCRAEGIHVIRTRAPLGELDQRTDPPTVGTVRMLWSCAMLLERAGSGTRQLRSLMSRADGKRLVKAAELHRVVRDPTAFGMPSVVPPLFSAVAVSLASGHSHSAPEALGRRIVTEVAARYGLAVEPRPLPIPDEEHPVAELDIAIPLIRLDVEIDGPHHDQLDQQRVDRRRDDKVRGHTWTVRRYRDKLVMEDTDRFRRLVDADIVQAAAVAGIILRQVV